MSFVITGVINNRLYMASDGQITKEDGSIYDNNYKKIKQFGQNVLVGFTGDVEICEKILDTSNYITSMLNLTTIINQSNPYDVAVQLFNKMNAIYNENKYDRNKRQCKMVIAGISPNTNITTVSFVNNYVIYTIESNVNKVVQRPLSYESNIHLTYLNSEHISTNKVNDILNKTFSKKFDNIEDYFKDIILQVSRCDRSVNSVTFIETI